MAAGAGRNAVAVDFQVSWVRAAGDIEARERLREKLPTCGLVIIDFAFDAWSKLHPQCGRLERFVSPKTLDAAAN